MRKQLLLKALENPRKPPIPIDEPPLDPRKPNPPVKEPPNKI